MNVLSEWNLFVCRGLTVLSARFLETGSSQFGSICFLSGLQSGTQKPQASLYGFLLALGTQTEVVGVH